MNIYLVDGTYELFRYFFAVPPAKDINGRVAFWALCSP
jgi:hypothetical protein